jgi:hypothetical protein
MELRSTSHCGDEAASGCAVIVAVV